MCVIIALSLLRGGSDREQICKVSTFAWCSEPIAVSTMNVAPGAGGDAGFPIDLRSIIVFPGCP